MSFHSDPSRDELIRKTKNDFDAYEKEKELREDDSMIENRQEAELSILDADQHDDW